MVGYLDCVHGCEQTLVRNLGEREIAYEIGKKKKRKGEKQGINFK